MPASSTPTYAHGHSAATVAGHSTRTAEFSAAYLIPFLSPGKAILDIGCGPGSITASFVPYVTPGGRVVGIDSSDTVISGAQAKYHGGSPEFLQGDLFKLPFEDETFDVVHAHQVIVHLPVERVAAALTEMKRVCKTGGLLAFRDGHPEKSGIQLWPHDPLLPLTHDLFCERMYSGGVTRDSQGRWLGIARDEVGFAKVKRQFSLDVYDTPEMREMWGNQWASRTSEDGIRSFVLERNLASRETLDKLPAAWRKWKDTEGGWCTLLQIEHMCWK